MDICEVLPLFSCFLRKYGSGVHVVFDGYSSGPTIKDHEHQRRSATVKQIATHRELDLHTKELGPQEAFLSNIANKSGLISLLKDSLRSDGISVHQAENDADALIVSVALECAKMNVSSPVAVLAEDTDIFVLLLHHRKSSMRTIYFCSEAKRGRGGKLIGAKCFNIGDVQSKIGSDSCQCLLAVHALGGCDSTSAIYGMGKGTIFSKISNDKTGVLRTNCLVLQQQDATDDEVCAAGTQLVVSLYGGKLGDRLTDLRYDTYCKISLSRRFQPERLPPSESATHMHVRRVHLQAVIWSTLGTTDIRATKWGWQLHQNSLSPIKSLNDVAPPSILKFVRCSCHGNCSSSMCSCRKNGLLCVSACGNCHGTNCTNAAVNMDVETDSDSEPDPDNVVESQLLLDDDLPFYYEEEV